MGPSWKHIFIRRLLALYGVTWTLSGLTLIPDLVCSISYLSSGDEECVTGRLKILTARLYLT